MSKISKIIEKKVGVKREKLVKNCVISGRLLIKSSKDYHNSLEIVRAIKRAIKSEQRAGNSSAVSVLTLSLRDTRAFVKSNQAWLSSHRKRYGKVCSLLKDFDEMVEAMREANPKSGDLERCLLLLKM